MAFNLVFPPPINPSSSLTLLKGCIPKTKPTAPGPPPAKSTSPKSAVTPTKPTPEAATRSPQRCTGDPSQTSINPPAQPANSLFVAKTSPPISIPTDSNGPPPTSSPGLTRAPTAHSPPVSGNPGAVICTNALASLPYGSAANYPQMCGVRRGCIIRLLISRII